jgi:protein-L-isoaspartate O-methyltransferase
VLVIPVGMAGKQVLQRVTRISEDSYDTEQFDSVIFVPFLSGKE